MNNVFIRTAAMLSVILASPLSAQETAAGDVDHATAIKQSLQQSAAALQQYHWVETTIISMKGEEKSRTQNSCHYDASGKVQKAPMGTAPEKKEKRGLRGRVAANKKEEVSESVQEAVALIHQYVPPDPAKIQAAKDAGTLSVVPPDPQGRTRITINDYLKAGDSLTIDVNAATNVMNGIAVSSFTDSKDAVGLNVTFATLLDGTVYSAKTTMEVAAQKLTVVVENSDYVKN